MKKRITFLIMLAIIFVLTSCGEPTIASLEKKAEKALDSGQYAEALELYYQALELGDLSEEGKDNYFLALCEQGKSDVESVDFKNAVIHLEAAKEMKELDEESNELLHTAYTEYGKEAFERFKSSDISEENITDLELAIHCQYERKEEYGDKVFEQKELIELHKNYAFYLEENGEIETLVSALREYVVKGGYAGFEESPDFTQYDNYANYLEEYSKYCNRWKNNKKFANSMSVLSIYEYYLYAQRISKKSIEDASVGDHVLLSAEEIKNNYGITDNASSPLTRFYSYGNDTIYDINNIGIQNFTYTVLEKENNRALLLLDIPYYERSTFWVITHTSEDLTRNPDRDEITADNPNEVEFPFPLGDYSWDYDIGKEDFRLLTYEDYLKYKEIIGVSAAFYDDYYNENREGCLKRWYLPDENTFVEKKEYRDYGIAPNSPNNPKFAIYEPNHRFLETTVVGGKILETKTGVFKDFIYEEDGREEDYNIPQYSYRVVAWFTY